MKSSYKWVVALFLSFVFLQGCSQSNVNSTVSAESNKKPIYQEITLKVEDSVKGEHYAYFFNGFIGDDTLAFQSHKFLDGKIRNIYHPAKVGYTFTFKNMDEVVVAEIINLDRDPGFITLKLEMKQ